MRNCIYYVGKNIASYFHSLTEITDVETKRNYGYSYFLKFLEYGKKRGPWGSVGDVVISSLENAAWLLLCRYF